MKPSEILTAARELISVPERWTQKVLARDECGEVCEPTEDKAVCFCSYGALMKIEGSEEIGNAEIFLRDQMSGSPGEFNDTHTHARVIEAFDRAITSAKEAGQ
jgi:hypothetical protein